MKKLFTPPFTKFSPKLILIAFTLLLITNSCKKELYNTEKIDPARKKELLAFKNGPKIEIINLAQFKDKANLNALGTLKQEFVSASSSKSNSISIKAAESYLGFNIITDNIKVIQDRGHTMYVFAIVLSSKRAISFQNLTIDESAAGTVAFVNTYTPTKKWIADWKKGRPGKFDGDIDVNYLKLNNGSPKSVSGTGIGNKKNNPNTISAIQCTDITYYFELPYTCGSGEHYPGDSSCELYGELAAGYMLFEVTQPVCVNVPDPPAPGGTTPNPPPTYDPCPEEPPLVSRKKSFENQIMIVPPTECDSVPTPADTTTSGVKNPCIKSALDAALGAGVGSKVKDLMAGTFMANNEINLDFSAFPFNPNGPNAYSDAYTIPSNGAQSYSQQIAFNTSLLPLKSKEYIVSTIYHEVLHAYLGNLFTYDTNGNYIIPSQHEQIVYNYLNMLSSDLKAIFPNLSETDARALSWGGLQRTSKWAMLTQTQRTEIEAIQTQYSTKTSTNSITSKGSYCQ